MPCAPNVHRKCNLCDRLDSEMMNVSHCAPNHAAITSANKQLVNRPFSHAKASLIKTRVWQAIRANAEMRNCVSRWGLISEFSFESRLWRIDCEFIAFYRSAPKECFAWNFQLISRHCSIGCFPLKAMTSKLRSWNGFIVKVIRILIKNQHR